MRLPQAHRVEGIHKNTAGFAEWLPITDVLKNYRLKKVSCWVNTRTIVDRTLRQIFEPTMNENCVASNCDECLWNNSQQATSITALTSDGGLETPQLSEGSPRIFQLCRLAIDQGFVHESPVNAACEPRGKWVATSTSLNIVSVESFHKNSQYK